jgi:hypothetical protein
MAPQGVSTVLGLESSPRPNRPPAVSQQFRFLKCLKISACDELGNVVGGLNLS